MRHANHTGGGAAGMGIRATALLLLVASPLVLAGCHDEERLRQRLEGPPVRLPVEPNQAKSPPPPALLDTVEPWSAPAQYGESVVAAWNLVSVRATGGNDLSYRVPTTWPIGTAGDATNAQLQVTAKARTTALSDSNISLATYAAQLAEGAPIYQYTTADGHIVYVTRRNVALAPSEPDAPRRVFHTSVVSIDGRIAKLDVSYDSSIDWRFNELSAAIAGSLQVRRRVS